MSKRYIAVGYRGPWNAMKMEVVGEFDERQEAEEFLTLNGFEANCIGDYIFIDRKSGRGHRAAIYDRSIYVPLILEEWEGS